MSPTFSSLALPNYRLWFIGSTVGNIGTWMQRIAQDWLVLTVLTGGSGLALGITSALQFGPVLLLSPWAGVLADRLPRRRLMVTTQAAMGSLALGLGLLVLSGQVRLWHVYVFAGLLGCASAMEGPVRHTFVAELVPTDSLPNAVALNSTSFHSARLIGPAVAGTMIAVVGLGWIFLVNALTFTATIVALARLSADRLHELPAVPRRPGQIREGLRYVRGRSDILMMFVVVGAVPLLAMQFPLTSALMVNQEFGLGAREFGLVSSVMAVGSVTGSLLAARRPRPRVRLVVGAAFGMGVCLALLAVMPTFETFALLCVPLGACTLTMMTSANGAIQVSTDPAMRGRVMAIYTMLFQGTIPVGALLTGWIGDHLGPRVALGAGSLCAVVVSLGVLLWARGRWGVEVRYRVSSRPHLQITGPAERAAAAGGPAARGGSVAPGDPAEAGGSRGPGAPEAPGAPVVPGDPAAEPCGCGRARTA